MISIKPSKSLIAIAMSAFIAATQAQATCNSTSLDCCWVVRSWQLMGQSTTVSSSSSTACCKMSGVRCTGSNVTAIDWSNQKLSGSIPPEIGNLPNLNWLDLSQNQLSGQITKELGNLKSLGLLSLNKNQLSGTIPPEIGNLTNLKFFDVADNQLSLPIPPEIKKLDSLVSIFLFGNKFEYRDIPADIREWIALKTEHADNNRDLFSGWPFQLGLGLGTGLLCLGIIQFKAYYAKKRTAQGTDQHQSEPTNSDQPEILAIKSEQL